MADQAHTDVELLEELMAPLTSKRHLQLWLKGHLGFTLPDQSVTKFANSNPLDFVWMVYRAIMDGKPLRIMALSGRDSGKTVALSVIDLLAMLHDQRSALHSAMTSAQATRARDYLQSYLLKNPILRSSIVTENQKLIELRVGGEKVGLELISLTPKAVQGAHYSLVSTDELASSMDPQQIKAYRDLSGVAGSHKLSGKPAVIVKITSRQSGASLAEQELKNAHKTGIVVVNWTTIDCMKACPPERSGTVVSPMNINVIKGLAFNDEEFVRMKDKDGFDRTEDTRDGCLKCPLLHYCQGRARFQTSESALLREIDDVITKVNDANSHEWVLSQLLSQQASSDGLVYPEFNPTIHIPGWDVMWEKLTGEPPLNPVNREMFIRELKRRGATFIAGVDWGYTAPATCVVLAIDDRDNIFVVEATGRVRYDDPEWVEVIKTQIHPKYDVQMYLPDAENPSGISLLRKADLPVAEIDKGPGSVKAGVNIVKGLLKIPGTNNRARIYFAPDIKPTATDIPGILEEFGLYAKEIDAAGQVQDDKYRKGNDHYCVAPHTMITTKSGAKPISQIVVGDEVLTHSGRYKSVTRVMVNPHQGPIKRLGVTGREDLLITGNHPILTCSSRRSFEDGNTGQMMVNQDFTWTKPEDIQLQARKTAPRTLVQTVRTLETDSVVIDMKELLPDYLEEGNLLVAGCTGRDGVVRVNPKARPIERYQRVDEDLAFTIGYFAAEGSKSGNPSKNKYGVNFTGHNREKTVEDLIKNVAARFGAKASFRSVVGNARHVRFNSKALYKLMEGCSSRTEKRFPDYATQLERPEMLTMVAGYMFGDAHFSSHGIKAGTISRELAYQLFTMLVTLGYRPNIKRAHRAGRWGVKNDQWIVSLCRDQGQALLIEICKEPRLNEIFKEKLVNLGYSKIKAGCSFKNGTFVSSIVRKVSEEAYDGLVYNLEVEGEHSYVANGIVVHNCDALRYALYWYYGKAVFQAVFANSAYTQKSHAPDKISPKTTELAEMAGVNVQDNRSDFPQLFMKQEEYDENGNPVKPDDDTDPTGTGGGGLQVAWT